MDEPDTLTEKRGAGSAAARAAELDERLLGCVEEAARFKLEGALKRFDAKGAAVFALNPAEAEEVAAVALRYARYASFLYTLYATVGVPESDEVLGDRDWRSWFVGASSWSAVVFADGFVALADKYRAECFLLYVFHLDGDRLRGVYLQAKGEDGRWEVEEACFVDAGRKVARKGLEAVKNAMESRDLKRVFFEWCKLEPGQPRLGELLELAGLPWDLLPDGLRVVFGA